MSETTRTYETLESGAPVSRIHLRMPLLEKLAAENRDAYDLITTRVIEDLRSLFGALREGRHPDGMPLGPRAYECWMETKHDPQAGMCSRQCCRGANGGVTCGPWMCQGPVPAGLEDILQPYLNWELGTPAPEGFDIDPTL